MLPVSLARLSAAGSPAGRSLPRSCSLPAWFVSHLAPGQRAEVSVADAADAGTTTSSGSAQPTPERPKLCPLLQAGSEGREVWSVGERPFWQQQQHCLPSPALRSTSDRQAPASVLRGGRV